MSDWRLVISTRRPLSDKGLYLSVRCDEHFVGCWRDCDADTEDGVEDGVTSSAAVEAEDDLIEVGLQMLAAATVVDVQCPGFEIGEDAMIPGQDDRGGPVSNDVRVV